MAANASISNDQKQGASLALPAAPMQVVALGDVNSNLLKTTDNSDGTSTLNVTGSVTSGGVAQGSTTSGQTGALTQAAVTTAAPSYTTGQTDPLSLTTAGSLRVVDTSTVAQASTTSGQVGGLAQGAVTTGDPTYTTAQTDPLSLTTAGGLRTFGKQYRDSIATVQISGTATAPSAAAVIATCTPGTAGIWEVVATVSISGTSVVATESNNMGLYQTAAAVLAPIIAPATTAGINPPVSATPVLLSLSGADTVNIKAIGNATAATPVYAAEIVCRRVG